MRTITKKDLVNSITEALTKQEALRGDVGLSDEARATRVKVTKVLVKDVIQHFLDKITDELLDLIIGRGFLSYSDVRDVFSRNQLKPL